MLDGLLRFIAVVSLANGCSERSASDIDFRSQGQLTAVAVPDAVTVPTDAPTTGDPSAVEVMPVVLGPTPAEPPPDTPDARLLNDVKYSVAIAVVRCISTVPHEISDFPFVMTTVNLEVLTAIAGMAPSHTEVFGGDIPGHHMKASDQFVPELGQSYLAFFRKTHTTYLEIATGYPMIDEDSFLILGETRNLSTLPTAN